MTHHAPHPGPGWSHGEGTEPAEPELAAEPLPPGPCYSDSAEPSADPNTPAVPVAPVEKPWWEHDNEVKPTPAAVETPTLDAETGLPLVPVEFAADPQADAADKASLDAVDAGHPDPIETPSAG